jgi:hypothetical protein
MKKNLLEKIVNITKMGGDKMTNEYGTENPDTLDARMCKKMLMNIETKTSMEDDPSFNSGQASVRNKIPKLSMEKIPSIGQKIGKSKFNTSLPKSPSPQRLRKKVTIDPVDKLRTTLQNYKQAKQDKLRIISDYAIMKFLKNNNPADLDPYALDRAHTFRKTDDEDLPDDIKKEGLLQKKIGLYELKLVFNMH